MTRRGTFRAGAAFLLALAALAAAPRHAGAEPTAPEAPQARACALLPVDALEKLYGASASPPSLANDARQGSFCSIAVGDHSVVLQSAAADAPESRTTVRDVLGRFEKLPANRARKFEVKDFGDVGCYRTKAPAQPDAPSPPWGNVCFLVRGGKLTLELTSDASKPLDFDVVRRLLLDAAARRDGAAR